MSLSRMKRSPSFKTVRDLEWCKGAAKLIYKTGFHKPAKLKLDLCHSCNRAVVLVYQQKNSFAYLRSNHRVKFREGRKGIVKVH